MKQYQRIKQYILDGIARGQWRAGQKLPSENYLAKHHGTSRMTVRRALDELAQQGVITRIQGAGTFVSANRTVALMQPIEDLATYIRRAGKTHSHRVIRHALSPDSERPQAVQAYDTKMAITEIVHFADDQPIQYEKRWTSLALLPDFLQHQFSEIDPSQYLLAHLPISSAWQRISAIAMPEQYAKHLATMPATPALLLERNTWSGERWVTYVQMFHPGDCFQLEAQLNMEKNHVKP